MCDKLTQPRGDTPSSRNRVRKIARILCVMIALSVLLSCSAFAATDTSQAIQDGVKTGMSNIWDILKGIVTPIAAVVVGVTGIQMLMGNEQDVQKAKKRIIICVIAILVVYFAPAAVEQVQGWFSSLGENTGVFS